MEDFKIGEKVIYDGAKFIITDIDYDCDTDSFYACLKPLEDGWVESEAKLSRLRKI